MTAMGSCRPLQGCEMERHEQYAIGGGAGLVGVTVALIYVLSFTPIAALARSAFSSLIIGVVIFGAVLSGGAWLARKGLDQDSTGMAVAGTALLAGGYGAFGAGILALLQPGLRASAAGVTLVASVALTLVSAGYVYSSDRDFGWAGRYSSYCFLGLLGFALIGTFTPALAVVAFVLAMAGFTLYLIHELWRLRDHRASWQQNALGVYIAFMGVFVHILQIVVRMYMDRE